MRSSSCAMDDMMDRRSSESSSKVLMLSFWKKTPTPWLNNWRVYWIPLAPPVMQHSSVIDLRNAAAPTPEERISTSLPCLQIFALLLPPETACPVRRHPLSSVSGRKRYNTLDFAEQNRVPTGCCSPLLETLSQRDCIPLDTCIFLHTAVPKL